MSIAGAASRVSRLSTTITATIAITMNALKASIGHIGERDVLQSLAADFAAGNPCVLACGLDRLGNMKSG